MFKVPESKIPETDLWFEFELPGEDGKPVKHKVRKLKFLNVGQQAVINGQRTTSPQVLDAIFGTEGTELGDAVRKLEDDQFDWLYNAWVDDSEVTEGESKGSSE